MYFVLIAFMNLKVFYCLNNDKKIICIYFLQLFALCTDNGPEFGKYVGVTTQEIISKTF